MNYGEWFTWWNDSYFLWTGRMVQPRSYSESSEFRRNVKEQHPFDVWAGFSVSSPHRPSLRCLIWWTAGLHSCPTQTPACECVIFCLHLGELLWGFTYRLHLNKQCHRLNLIFCMSVCLSVQGGSGFALVMLILAHLHLQCVIWMSVYQAYLDFMMKGYVDSTLRQRS